MRVRNEQAPPGAFAIEESKPGFIKVRLFRDAVYHDKPYWEYEEYHLELPDTTKIDDIIENYDSLMDEAMANE